MNERRGNLTSLINGREIIKEANKTSSLQTQSSEIASRMQRHQLSLFSNYHLRQLAMTNDGTQEAPFL